MRQSLLRRMLFVGSLCFSFPLQSQAADVEFNNPDKAVNAYGITTYLDLAKRFVPDIKSVENGYVGKTRTKIRHIGGAEFESKDADSYGLFDIASTIMNADGKKRRLVLFDFAQAADAAQGLAVLALYDAGIRNDFLDAVDVGFDESTYFFDQATLSVADGSDVILTMSSHFNSNQSYNSYSMLLVRNDRIEHIDTIPLVSDRTCAAEHNQEIRFASNPAKARPYAPITVFVTDMITPTGEDCGSEVPPQEARGEIRVTYSWDEATKAYRPDSDALKKLAVENGNRF